MAFVEEPAAFFLRATDIFKYFDSNGDGMLLHREGDEVEDNANLSNF